MKKIRGQIVYSLEERLQRLSILNKETGCIEWISSMHNGYGKLIIGSRSDGTRKTITAHRLAYMVYKGKIPKGMLVCHHCDNRGCINPDHLFIGTYQDNTDDREIKGRNVLPIRLKGEKHPRSKLKLKDVKKVKELKSLLTQQQIANLFKVSRSTIKDILLEKTWRSFLPEPPKAESK